jgi:predicted extracellular nuclease
VTGLTLIGSTDTGSGPPVSCATVRHLPFTRMGCDADTIVNGVSVSLSRRSATTAAVTAALLAVGALVVPGVAAAASPDIVVSEVYGGGGNSGAPLSQDFVELGNGGASAVEVSGLSVQYLPASPSPTSNWAVTPLTGSVAPGGRYLVAQARGATPATELPTPDATGTIAMSATGGTIALVTGTTALTCRTAADCLADPRIRDLVGYGGSTVVREGTPTPSTSNTTSAARATFVDTDDNAADFTVGAPTPEGTGGGVEEPPPPVGTPARIHDVQGTTRVSPLVGQLVAVPGVVTAVRTFGSARGFWFQDPQPDADPATSEGLFAFTGSASPAVVPGDAVTVTGTVSEFRPGGVNSANQSITQLTGPTAVVASSGNPLPAAEVLADDTVPDAYTPEANGGSIEALPLDPTRFALDFYESREGMRIGVADARVVGATDDFNGLFVTSKPQQNPTIRGGTLYGSYADQNSGRLKIESLIPFAQRPFPQVNVGDRLAGATEGPLDYTTFGGYVLLASTLGQPVTGTITREVTGPAAADQLTLGTYNVENLDPTDPQAKFDTLARGIVTNMLSPDVVGLEEIQDNTGPANNGVVASDQTLTRFIDAIVAAGGPRYEFRVIDPENNQDGGEPGGNIRVAFLFNPARVSFVDRPGGDATTAVQAVAGPTGAALSVSPGRVDPQNPAWDSSRKPLVGEFVFQGQTVFVTTNHFASKGGDQPLHGRFQPPNRSSEIQRTEQARVLRGFVDQLAQVDRQAKLVVLGDLNDFPFSPTLDILTGQGGLRSLIDTLPRDERYSYVFDGNSQTLDHILVSRSLGRVDYDVVRINAEFADQASDHDPQVTRIRLR